MVWINLRNFFRRCEIGFVALLIGALVFGIGLAIGACATDDNNFDIRVENERAISGWEKSCRPILMRNATIKSLKAGTTAGVEFPKDYPDLARSLELALIVINAPSAEARTEAYCDFLRVGKLPDSTPYGLYLALTSKDLSPENRYNLLYSHVLLPNFMSKQQPDLDVVDGLVRSWLKGERPEPQEPPKPPKAKPLKQIWWNAWLVFAAVLVGLVQIVMALGYFVDKEANNRRERNWIPAWALPTNPAGWLIMLLFAPAFAVPWLGRGVFRVALWPIGLALSGAFGGVKWALVDFDLSEPPRKIRAWREARRELKRRKKAEEQVRVAEEAALGQDVIRARLKLQHLLELAKLEKNDALRQRLEQISRDLEQVTKSRRSKHADPVTETAGTLTELVDDLAMEVAGMAEAESFIN